MRNADINIEGKLLGIPFRYAGESIILGILLFGFFLLLAAGLFLFGTWIVWLLWTWIFPYFLPDANSHLTQPGYWIFSGAIFLLILVSGFIRKLVFGTGKE